MLNGIGIAVLVIVGLIVVVGSIRKKRLLFSKGVFFMLLIGVSLIAVSGFQDRMNPQAEVQAYEQNTPSVKDAPYYVQTPSRAFYVIEYYENADHLVLQRFYSYDYKKWRVESLPLFLDKSLPDYMNVQVIKRRG